MIYTEERWEQYGITVERETVPIGNDDGTPKLNADGTPVTADRYVIVAVHQPTRRAIRLALGDERRLQIASDLAGGVILPGNGKPHLPFGSGV